jgi:hypothetical protein
MGMTTRYVVDVDGGGELLVIAQNLDSGALQSITRGAAVRASWQQSSMRALHTAGQ